MKASSILFMVAAIAAAPLALALTAFVSGLWQSPPREHALREEELGI
ncbi:MAG: hypothetical protein HOH74_20660 [Gemmatimonadetes bacterium]|jgi:hypothetical protein|nr:hypothetical protein [Gemmatimonadota bacterium]